MLWFGGLPWADRCGLPFLSKLVCDVLISAPLVSVLQWVDGAG